MKSLIWAIVILIVSIGFMMENRYVVIIHSPVVAKLDRLTGDTWIVNSGVWRKIAQPPEGAVLPQEKDIVAKSTEKAK